MKKTRQNKHFTTRSTARKSGKRQIPWAHEHSSMARGAVRDTPYFTNNAPTSESSSGGATEAGATVMPG